MKKVLVLFIGFILLYFGVVNLQLFFAKNKKQTPHSTEILDETTHKVHVFSFAKYNPSGEKEIEIEGDTANILEQIVLLSNVVAKAYAEEVAITITADKGKYDKKANEVLLQKNVVGTTENGTRMLTEEMTIYPTDKTLDTQVDTEVKKDNINIEGEGASADTTLKKIKFKKNVTVVIQDTQEGAKGPTVITCDGPLVIDYEKNIAHFRKNVIAKDTRGTLRAEAMDVYYNRISKKVSKIVAQTNVVIENPDGNKTYSDTVIYLAEEGRIILGGDTEALYFEGDTLKKDGAFV